VNGVDPARNIVDKAATALTTAELRHVLSAIDFERAVKPIVRVPFFHFQFQLTVSQFWRDKLHQEKGETSLRPLYSAFCREHQSEMLLSEHKFTKRGSMAELHRRLSPNLSPIADDDGKQNRSHSLVTKKDYLLVPVG
jgi:hypothetical protein